MNSTLLKSETGFTLVEMLIAIVIISVLTSLGVLAYGKQREKATDVTVKSDVDNMSTFMKDEFLIHEEYPDAIPSSFGNWTKDNELILTQEGSCVEGSNPGYDSIFWRYSLVDNKLSQEPCPPPGNVDSGEEYPDLPEEEDSPPPEAGGNPPPAPGDDDYLGYEPAHIVRADPVLFTGFNNQSTNNLHLDNGGDLLVEGDFECNSDVIITGVLVVTGNAYLTNNCYIEGDLWVGGDLRINSTPHIIGDVLVKGDISTQSTATIEGNVWTTGRLTSNDGRTIEQLQDMGSIGGFVEEKVYVPSFDAEDFPVNKVNGTLISWSDWLKQQASYSPSTPSWSPVYQGNGCTVSPGQNWSLADDIQIKQPTNVDARGCSSVEIGAGGTVQLEADLTLFVNGFKATDGIHFKSKDGQQHDVNIIVPTAGDVPNRTCSSNGSIVLGSSTGDPNVRVTFYTESQVQMYGTTTFTGQIMTGCSNISNNVTIINPN